jgi:serine/threonine protein kinase
LVVCDLSQPSAVEEKTSRNLGSNSAEDGGDRSPMTKAVTSHRTPKIPMSITSGTKLGRYEIRSKLGEGGIGEVYRARDTRLDREVPIKLRSEV